MFPCISKINQGPHFFLWHQHFSEKDSQPKEMGGAGGPVRVWLPKAKSASLWMLEMFSGLWLKKKTHNHFCLNLQCLLPPPAGLPTWLERHAMWKGCNEPVLSGPEVGLLSWVHSVPSLPPPPEEALGEEKSGSVQPTLMTDEKRIRDSSC